MKYFWLRFSGFIILWGYWIFQYSHQKSISILIFAGAITLFFFLSLPQVSIYLYVLHTVIITIHSLLLTDDSFMAISLLGYLSIIASLRLKDLQLIIYTTCNLILSIVLCLFQTSEYVDMIFILSLFYFVLFALHKLQGLFREQRNLYEQLQSEFRKQKRVVLLAEQNARTEERNRIARDIHDSVGHRLTALIMKLEMLAIQTKDKAFRSLKTMAEESLEETRHAVKTLQEEETEGIATVVHLIRKLEAESQMVVQFTLKQGVLTVPLSNHKSVVLYRVIQEALTNAMRHGSSRQVQVVLGKSAIGDVTFEISNTISELKSFEYGFGLTTMQERINEVSGRLHIYQTEKQFVVSGIIPA